MSIIVYENNGFTILQVWDSDVTTIKITSQILRTKDFKDEYQGVSKGMFSSRSPKMILLQPIEYNAVGEKIILVDGKKVLESVLMERPKLAKISSMGVCPFAETIKFL
ncbi:8906_t:CDS:2 [Entrophospora sp. SA101]|nr:8906_t:CDS:2 [Entrophospora sp. SA101]